MKNWITLFIFSISLIVCISTNAQEEYRDIFANDSTFHVLNSDTTVVAGKQRLYLSTAAGVSLLHDFTNDGQFIRDFDIVSDDKWYAIIGDPGYLAPQPALLFQSTDKGQTWLADTSFYPVSRPANLVNHDAVHHMHRLSEDTLLMFLGYYQCAILYSTNGGTSWNKWFDNYFANYQGLLECGDDFYLWGFQGDGFPASMFKIPAHLMLSPDTNFVWSIMNNIYHPPCHNYSIPDCVYGLNPSPNPFYLDYLHFKSYLDTLCNGITTAAPLPIQESTIDITVSPNPSTDGKFFLSFKEEVPYSLKIYSVQGQLLESHHRKDSNERINLSIYGKGLYFLVIETEKGAITKKVVYH